MALKIDRIIEDLSDPNPEIQILALTTVPRITADVSISSTEYQSLQAAIGRLAKVENPDIIFLARKAQNFLTSRIQSPGGLPEPAAERPPPPPPKPPPPKPKPVERTTDEIVASLETESDVGKLATALATLKEAKDPKILKSVAIFLDHVDPRVRANAVEVYDSLGDRDAIGLLLPKLRDDNNRVRANALKALGKYQIPEVTGCLQEMLKSDQVRMRESALYAVTCLKDLKVFPLLGPLTQDPYDGIRKRLVDFLESQRTPWSDELLKRMVGDRDKEIRDKVVSVLVSRGLPVEELLSNVARDASEMPALPLEPKDAPDSPPPDPVLDSTVERSFKTTFAQILRDLRNQERRALMVRVLFQAGIYGYRMCGSGEFKHAEARSLYYEVEQYHAFLRQYTAKLDRSGKDTSQLQMQIVTTGLAQYQGRLKVALVRMGRLLATAVKEGQIDVSEEMREALQGL